MSEHPRPGSMWSVTDPTVGLRLEQTLDQGIDESRVDRPVVWFRADDVGVPSRNFFAMLDCFQRHDVPLALAVVPSWLSRRRWREIQERAGNRGRWCFHQHGRRHLNHEPHGRKSEFGPSRSRDAKARDVLLGKKRLEGIMGKVFRPVFTPPWNRFTGLGGQWLNELGFMAASRNDKAFLRDPIDLPEIPVNCDLHTRHGAADQAWTDFFAELRWWLRQGLLGMMLHHQRMNDRALEFLDVLLASLRGRPRLRLAGLDELAGDAETLRTFAAAARGGALHPSVE